MTGLLHQPTKGKNSNPQLDRAVNRVVSARAARANEMSAANQLAADNWRQRIIAIDPGDAHCGVATFREGKCTVALECNPKEMLTLLQQVLDDDAVEVVIYEVWRLYQSMTEKLVGSEMLTCQAIGVIKWLVDRHNETVDSFAKAHKGETFGGRIVELVAQPADIKDPTRTVVRHHGITPTSRKTSGDHERDAELHGLHFILRGQGLIRGSEGNRA